MLKIAENQYSIGFPETLYLRKEPSTKIQRIFDHAKHEMKRAIGSDVHFCAPLAVPATNASLKHGAGVTPERHKLQHLHYGYASTHPTNPL